MSTQHTPAPWLLTSESETVHGYSEEGEALIVVYELGTNEADHHLIAAAPELLAELRIVYERSYNPFEPDNQSEQYKRVGALIAKATGSPA